MRKRHCVVIVMVEKAFSDFFKKAKTRATQTVNRGALPVRASQIQRSVPAGRGHIPDAGGRFCVLTTVMQCCLILQPLYSVVFSRR